MVKLFELIPSLGNLDSVLALGKDPHNFTVREVDDMVLISYKRDVTNFDCDFYKYLRGMIINKDSLEVLCYGLDSKTNNDEFRKQNNFENVQVQESIDGTMVNLFYYGDSWRVSTKTMINAADSHFYSKRSFLDLFMESKGDYDLNTLDHDYTYTFVLVHPENRIVSNNDKCELVHVHSRNMKTFSFEKKDIGFRQPIIYDMKSYEELDNTLETLVYNNEGFMLYNKDDNSQRTKCKGKAYNMVKDLRGNQRNNLYRILELRKENDKKKYREYFKFYPEFKDDDYFLSSEIKNIINDILNIYNMVKKDKVFVEIPQHLKTPIFELHQFYKELMTEWTKKKEEQKNKNSNEEDEPELRRPSINYRGIHIYFLKLPVYKQYYLLKRNLEYKLVQNNISVSQ
tara:strand:- start:9554 stop:10750 length:1197 start_codon:yes stop_codon:yes gene_type:complete